MNKNITTFKATPMFTLKTLKTDKRGRVRFTSQGCRFEVTKNGLNVYDRSQFLGKSHETPAYFNINRLTSKTLKLIARAVNLVNA